MGNKIKDLPPLQRPREKAFRYGLSALSDEEVLALIIGSGAKENSAKDIAYAILNKNKGLYNASLLPYQSFLEYKGLERTKALKIAASFELARRVKKVHLEDNEQEINEAYLFNKYSPIIENQKQESLYLIMLNRKHKLIHEETLYRGTNNNVPFSLKDIFRELVNHEAKYFYLIHNHPGGNIDPSNADLLLTEELIRESQRFGIPLLDHLIISKEGYFSFKNSMQNPIFNEKKAY